MWISPQNSSQGRATNQTKRNGGVSGMRWGPYCVQSVAHFLELQKLLPKLLPSWLYQVAKFGSSEDYLVPLIDTVRFWPNLSRSSIRKLMTTASMSGLYKFVRLEIRKWRDSAILQKPFKKVQDREWRCRWSWITPISRDLEDAGLQARPWWDSDSNLAIKNQVSIPLSHHESTKLQVGMVYFTNLNERLLQLYSPDADISVRMFWSQDSMMHIWGTILLRSSILIGSKLESLTTMKILHIIVQYLKVSVEMSKCLSWDLKQ